MPQENQRNLKLTWRTRFCYGVGHILNDLCASMWFTYLLVYLHRVVGFPNVTAGSLLLIGQVSDALATPFVGVESDKTGGCKYGRRKIWHLVGVACVACTFPFIFNLCIKCEHAAEWALFLYYVPFIVIFQFGWASTQISHLSLIPELTDCENEKVTLNAIRYACTVGSNIFVFIVTWIFLSKESDVSSSLNPSDSTAFMHVVFVVVGTGLLFMLIFHVGVKEPPRGCTYEFITCKGSKRSASNWVHWFKEIQFYQVALLYMCTRLTVNITQVYIPMYALDTLKLSKDTIAKIPLVVYVCGFLSTFLSKPLNKSCGRKTTYICGLVITAATSVWMYFIPSRNYYSAYGSAALLGIGGSTLLVTVLTMLADLIGENVETGAFVYGAMSFTDKLSNGVAIQMIQLFHPCSMGRPKPTSSVIRNSTVTVSPNTGTNHPLVICGSACGKYYREVMVFVAGGATIIALLGLLTMCKTKIGDFRDDKEVDPNVQEKLLKATTTVSESNGTSTDPRVIYEPPNQPCYRSMETNPANVLACSIQEEPETTERKCNK